MGLHTYVCQNSNKPYSSQRTGPRLLTRRSDWNLKPAHAMPEKALCLLERVEWSPTYAWPNL